MPDAHGLGPRHARWLSALVIVLLMAMTGAQVVSASASGSTSADAGSVSSSSSDGSADDIVYEADDCSACCASTSSTGLVGGSSVSLACCDQTQPRNLFGTVHGECSGLPCCSYGGRKAQNHQAWFPCLLFPTCNNDSNYEQFCDGNQEWSYIEGADFTCDQTCCSGPVLASNVWEGVELDKPGQTNATFSVTFTPTDYMDLFYSSSATNYVLEQIMLASPIDYNFTSGANCWIAATSTATSSASSSTSSSMSKSSSSSSTSSNNASYGDSTTCVVSTFDDRTYLTVNIPATHQNNHTFTLTFDSVVTPTGINTTASHVYSSDTNLAPVYYIFNDTEGTVFDSFYRVTALGSAALSSGSFFPENIYPGNSGNASLAFYTDARIPEGSSVTIEFGAKWKFTSSAKWQWEYFTSGNEVRDNRDANHTSFNESGNAWTFVVEETIDIGWIGLSVDKVKNPSVADSGLNMAVMTINDPQDRLIVRGRFSAISIDLLSGATASPYNYVTMVVLICTLMFCSVVIKGHGLAFSLGSIWTDITAICTVLALCTAILNNLWWTFDRTSVYFYIWRLYLCFTFTMLTAVCFHWGTVLSLRLRKLPKATTSMAFVLINALFYALQVSFLISHRDLIRRVYESENDPTSYANQQCKSNVQESVSNVFSDIQGYFWYCYAADQDTYFMASTVITDALFVVLTLTVMALGFMVMRRGKLLLRNSSGPHQVVLIKALRLYYALIGVVTLVYLVSWIVQMLSRRHHYVSYPWYYIFTVWLPCSIPPSCLIFLQWNATTKPLRDVDTGDEGPLSQWGYGEIRTPSFAFSTSDRWTEESSGYKDLIGDDDDILSNDPALMGKGQVDDYIGLSMCLEASEVYGHGCYIAIQRLDVDKQSGSSMWRQISNTDTVDLANKDLSSAAATGRYLYPFLAVPRIPVSSSDEKIRLVVYSVNSPVSILSHSDMTASEVLAALDRQSSNEIDDDLEDQEDDGSSSLPTHKSSFLDLDGVALHSQAIDELFEAESDDGGESTLGSSTSAPTYSVAAEFTVSTGLLVTSGARNEQIVLTATENSYKSIEANPLPPKLSVHTVIPKSAGKNFGFGDVNGLSAVHSISSQYHIREQGLLVVEDLTESRFSNWIPRQVLEVIIRHRSKGFLIAQSDLARLEAYDQQRQKGSDRGIYENLIQQIQDDGDLNRCREWMVQRCQYMKDYVDLLRRMRRLYVIRDHNKNYFKPSTEKKNPQLRFLPINLHLQEMWVGRADSNADAQGSNSFAGNTGATVYDIVTVGAMAAHVYKFKNGGILGLESQHAKMKSRSREEQGSPAAHHQNPLWTEEEQKADNLEWDILRRLDVCFPQAVAALVTSFTRKIDLAMQNTNVEQGKQMLEQMEKLGFLFQVESLVSTHGNEAGMLEDMAGALNELRNVRFVLVDEHTSEDEDLRLTRGSDNNREVSLSFHMDDESKETHSSERSHGTNTSSSSGAIAGVVDVNVFTSLDDALSIDGSSSTASPKSKQDSAPRASTPNSPMHSNSFSGVRDRLISTIKATSNRLLNAARAASSSSESSVDKLMGCTHLVIRVNVRTSNIKLSEYLRQGGTINVVPLLFTQGINEKQTIANNTGSSVTRLQDEINERSLRTLRRYCDRYCNYTATVQALQISSGMPIIRDTPTREEVTRRLTELEKLIALSRQNRKKRPEILQFSSDLCRRISAGRVTVCKSAKDRTGMSVTLEQGRILVQNHGLPEYKKMGIVTAMRSEGVRIENALKNTGRRMFAFNALQRSLLPEEYRCPPQTGGRNVS